VNHALAIARRELRDRSRLFILAAAFAVIPFLASLLPGASAHRADVIAMGGAILGVALGLGTAVALGNTTVVGELVERRLSFYFSRPISPAALWFGKVAAALATSIACLLLIALPSFLAAGSAWRSGIIGARAVLLVATGGIVVLFFVSHAAATIVRSRSPLVALDVVALTVASVVTYLILRAVAYSGALEHAAVLLGIVLAAVLALLAVVPVWQLAHGRTEARRGHAAFSRAFWPAVAVVLAVVGLYSAWLTRPPVSAVTTVQHLEQAPAGDWLLLSGETSNRFGYQATFAVNRATGETIRMPLPLWWGASFSRDGRSLAWVRPEGVKPSGRFVMHVRRLDEQRTYVTGIGLSRDTFVLSDDGSRVAVINGRMVAVHEVATGRLVASAAGLNARGSYRMFFASPDVVRVLESLGRELRIFELNTATRSFAQTGQQATEVRNYNTSSDGSRLLLKNEIVDGRTGAVVATLPPWNVTMSRERMLSDGSVARSGFDGRESRVQLFDAAGTLRHELVLPGVKNTFISGDTADGKLLVMASREVGKEHKTFVLDLRRGVIEYVREGVRGPWPAWSSDPRRTPFRGELVSVDAASGEAVLWDANGRREPHALLR
jgi:hypothetical protein